MPSLPALPFYQDGDYATPQLLWTSGRDYPFAADGDMATYTYRRRYLVRAASYAPTAPGTVDPLEAGSYLLAETPPDRARSPLAEIERIYGRIPASRLTYGALTYALPQVQAPSGTSGTFPRGFDFLDGRAYQPSEVSNTTHLYSRRPVTADTGVPTDATGGTFTLTFDGQTTGAIAYNASNATIQTAVNALSTVVTPWGSFTVTTHYGANGQALLFTVANQASNPTIDAALITQPSGVVRTAYVYSGARGTFISGSIRTSYNASNPAPAITANLGGLTATGLGSLTNGNAVSADLARVSIGVTAYPTTISGTYTLTVGADTTAPLAYNATAAEVRAALNALASVQAIGQIAEVYGSTPGTPPYSVTPSINIAARWVPKITGGTFTVTLFGATTSAIAYNATAATIKTAVDALAGVSARGGATVTRSDEAEGGGFGFTVLLKPSLFVGDATSLTPSGYVYKSTAYGAITGTGVSLSTELQTCVRSPVAVGRTITCAGHGYSPGAIIYYKSGGTYSYGVAAGILALDADTLALDPTLSPWSAVGTITELGVRVALYTPRAVRVRTRTTRDYYLPGVSAGIATLGDLPLGFAPLSDEVFFAAIFARAIWAPYETSDPARWQGDIYELAQTEIQISNLG